MNDAINVDMHPPINPSHVFFGDNSISLVLPKLTPKIYAKMSFVITNEHGNMNHTIPSNMFIVITEL